MKKIPPIVWGIILITILFIAVVILINGFSWIRGVVTDQPPAPPDTVVPASTLTPSVTVTAANTPWINQGTRLYFPVLPLNIYQYSLIQIKNTGPDNANDIKVTLLNRSGESQTYQVSNLEPGSINRFSFRNLADVPLNFSPGIAIVSSDSSLAAVAETFQINSDEKNPVESLSPLADLRRDLNFTVYPTSDNEPAQNRLSLTNPQSKLIEVQVTLTTSEKGSRIIFTKEIPPLTTEIVELPIEKFKSFDQTATVIASGTDQIIGAIYHLDKDGGLLSNISMD